MFYSLTGWEEDEARRLLREIESIANDIESKSQVIQQTVEAAKPGLASDVSLANLFSERAGSTARQWFTLRDRQNALFEEGRSLFAQWNSYINGQTTLAGIQGYYQRFVDVLNAHSEFLGEAQYIVEKGPEQVAREKAPPGLIEGTLQDVIFYGAVGLIIYKVVVPSLQKKYT